MMRTVFPYGIGWVIKSGEVEYEEQIRESFQDIRKIDADISAFAGKLKIELSDVEQVIVETDNIGKDLGFSCTQSGEELELKTKDKFLDRNRQGKGNITVYLPETLNLKELKIELGAGYLYLDNVCVDELKIDAGAGEAELIDFCADEAKMEAGVGKLTARGMVIGDIELEAGVGCIEYTVAGREEDFDYEIQVGVGTVKCADSDYSGLGFEKVIDNHAGRKMDIDCGVGSVNVQFDENMQIHEKEGHSNGN